MDEPTLSTFLSYSVLQPPHKKAMSLALSNIRYIGGAQSGEQEGMLCLYMPSFWRQGLVILLGKYCVSEALVDGPGERLQGEPSWAVRKKASLLVSFSVADCTWVA